MKLSNCVKVYYWPRITSVWFTLTFIITYLISTLNGHIQELVPFISDTGSRAPESCILAQMMNIGAIFTWIGMYVRYRQVDVAISSNDITLPSKWNAVGMWSGGAVCLGISMVGSFQKTNMPSMHFVGAFLAFGIAIVYMVAQTRISFAFRQFYDKYPEYEVGPSVIYYRLFLTISYCLTFVVVVISGVISSRHALVNKISTWNEDIDGYHIHLCATITEWILFVLFIAYTLTGTKEFKTVEFEEIRFRRTRSNVKS